MRRYSVLVPYRPDGAYRDAAWRFAVKPAWEAKPGAELIVESPGEGAHPGEFNHPKAINAAAARASHELLIIADADCAWTPSRLPEMLLDVVEQGASWAMAQRYATLSKRQSHAIISGVSPPTERFLQRAPWVGDSVSWAGLVCVHRDDFFAVGGYDERFAWWGSDDVAFGAAMTTLVGEHVRVSGAVLHLWHPAPLAETYGHQHHRAQYNLAELYKSAIGDEAAMRQVRFGEQ